jgi:hypothetical protein
MRSTPEDHESFVDNEPDHGRRRTRRPILPWLLFGSMLVALLGVGLTCVNHQEFAPISQTPPAAEETTKAEIADPTTQAAPLAADSIPLPPPPPRVFTPCERLNEATQWRLDDPVPVIDSGIQNKKRAPKTTYHAKQGVHALLDGTWIDCPDRDFFSIGSKQDWDRAWRANHPRQHRAPLRRFRPEWAMNLSLEPPLLQVPSDSISVGFPHDGYLQNGAHLPTEQIGDYPYFLDRSPERAGFSTHAMHAFVVAMQQAMRTLGPKYEGMQFVILDASLVSGGKMVLHRNENKAHGSHQSGRDVDVAIALRIKKTRQIWWAGDPRREQKFNSKRNIDAFLKHIGEPALAHLTRDIRSQRAARDKARKAKGRKPIKYRNDAASAAFQLAEDRLSAFIFDAIWQLVLKAWFPGNLRWIFLDEPQQKMLVQAAVRAGQGEFAKTMIAYDARRKRYRKPTPVRCLHQPKETCHDRHIHLRFNCGLDEKECRD